MTDTLKKETNTMTETSNNRTLSILTHVLGLFFGFLAPLIILLASKEECVKKHSKNSLNWQLTYLLCVIIPFFLIFFLPQIFLVLAIIYLFFFVLMILDIVFCIIAAVKASNNKIWKYPLAIPFTKA